MLNFVWLAFFVVALLTALLRCIVIGDWSILAQLTDAAFAMARLSVDIALGLVGLLCFWLGLLRLADKGGLTTRLADALTPLFARLAPAVPAGHPAIASMAMNCAANMLGLDNAATPIGLRAMRELQSLNPDPEQASSAQMLFMVLNTAAITLFPVTVMMYRSQAGSHDPAAVFIPILLASIIGTCAGIAAIVMRLRLPVWDRVVLAYVAGLAAIIFALLAPALYLPRSALAGYSSALGNGLLLAAIAAILINAAWQKVALFDEFIEGAKEGFQLAISLIPYLVAMLVAIGLLRASGALGYVLDALGHWLDQLGLDSRFVSALPTGLMKIFSGSGARAMMLDTMHKEGADSFAGMLAGVLQGSSETTFYVLTVYGGAVGLKRWGAALPCALFADAVGIAASIFIGYWFFG